MSTVDPQILHRLQLSRQPKAKKVPQPIAKRGEKVKEEFKGYKKQIAEFLAKPENKNCKIEMEGCTKIATCVHHVAGRTGEKLKDEKDWLPSCQSCNLWVEENDAEAREKGFKKTRLGKVNK